MPKYPFIRWFMSTQLVNEKGEAWLLLFKNLIAVMLVTAFVVLSIRQIPVPQEFNLLLGIVIGSYYKNIRKRHESGRLKKQYKQI